MWETITATTSANSFIQIPEKSGYSLVSAHCIVPNSGYTAQVTRFGSANAWGVFVIGYNASSIRPHANQSATVRLLWMKDESY